ncbi:hypothetical protein Ccel01_32990 [Cellulosimicrobium cellulans]|uniref:Uncharacterized protein n=1 Tax=Cellulosimicrobium cellulans TaxID=1710 RepID=A0AAV5PBX9_CELCE|nr:hypothetical protein Ccel01_32990 [Cellulosimicrobium cellulans]
MLAPREALLLRGGDHPAVDDEGGGRVVEQGVDSEDAHGLRAFLVRVRLVVRLEKPGALHLTRAGRLCCNPTSP